METTQRTFKFHQGIFSKEETNLTENQLLSKFVDWLIVIKHDTIKEWSKEAIVEKFIRSKNGLDSILEEEVFASILKIFEPLINGFINHKLYIPFLDYEIRVCTNSDGLVLMANRQKPFVLWETHLGNFRSLDHAKESALRYFMIARPQHFATVIANKLSKKGSGTVHEYYKLFRILQEENIPMPIEITVSHDMNAMIMFNGEII